MGHRKTRHLTGGAKKKTAAQMDKKRNKPRVHSGRGDQQADLQTKTQDSSDPTNLRATQTLLLAD